MTNISDKERKALEIAAELKARIKSGISKSALQALKKKFGYNLPAYQYLTNGAMPLSGQDVELIKLHAAVRDGQREVISYIEQILNPDDE